MTEHQERIVARLLDSEEWRAAQARQDAPGRATARLAAPDDPLAYAEAQLALARRACGALSLALIVAVAMIAAGWR